eukprot:355791-Chlamydomonas_euryale.AAC.9
MRVRLYVAQTLDNLHTGTHAPKDGVMHVNLHVTLHVNLKARCMSTEVFTSYCREGAGWSITPGCFSCVNVKASDSPSSHGVGARLMKNCKPGGNDATAPVVGVREVC